MSIQRQSALAPLAEQPGNWRAAIIAGYTATANGIPHQMRRRLAQRLLALTGRVVVEQAIAVDASRRQAIAKVDGVMFQLCDEELAVVRPCAHCGTGRFASAAITNRMRLGYALAVWEPYHPDCAPSDPPDDVSW